MDDEIAMRVLDCLTDGEEEPQTVGNVQPVFVTELVEGRSIDILHDEVGTTVLGDASVQEAGDVGMGDPRQDLSFGEEASPDVVASDVAAVQLERDPLFELPVRAPSEVDRAHSAAADLLDDFVSTDAGAGHRCRGGGSDRAPKALGHSVEPAVPRVRFEELEYL